MYVEPKQDDKYVANARRQDRQTKKKLTAVWTRSESVSSALPPGRAVCPGWARRSLERVVRRTRSSPPFSYNRTRTAPSFFLEMPDLCVDRVLDELLSKGVQRTYTSGCWQRTPCARSRSTPHLVFSEKACSSRAIDNIGCAMSLDTYILAGNVAM